MTNNVTVRFVENFEEIGFSRPEQELINLMDTKSETELWRVYKNIDGSNIYWISENIIRTFQRFMTTEELGNAPMAYQVLWFDFVKFQNGEYNGTEPPIEVLDAIDDRLIKLYNEEDIHKPNNTKKVQEERTKNIYNGENT